LTAILQVRGLAKSFGGVAACGGVDLDVEKGQICSVIGPNGAGKTTLFNLISGYYRCDAGKVIFKGKDITGLAPEKIVRLGMGRSFQVTNIFPRLSVFENVQATVLFNQGRGLCFFSDSRRQARKETEDILAQVNLTGLSGEAAGVLSAGDRKRLELGIVLAARPDLILLDEPTCGMSPTETTQTIRLIREICGETAITALLTEHKMDLVFSVSSQISVMNFGLVIASGAPDEIRNNPKVREVYLGNS
jgi:branched-chain amino acid transport system ATP-binding protein